MLMLRLNQFLVWLCLAVWVSTAPAQVHHDPPLGTSAELSLATTLEATAERYGLARELAADQRFAERLRAQAELPFAQAPALFVRYNRDWPGADLGLAEWEAQLLLTLKRPGVSPAQRAWALASEQAASRDAVATRLMLCGLVREALWDIRLGEVSVANAEAALALAEEMEALATQSFLAGALSKSDQLLARAETLARRQALDSAELVRVDAERAYIALTGLDRVPAIFDETAVQEIDIDAHPAMLAAAAAVEQAQQGLASQRLSSRSAPTVQIGPRFERGDRTSPYADSFGVQVTLPFGTEAYADSQLGASERAVTSAELAQLRLKRDLELAWHEAHHELEIAENQLARALEAESLTAQRAEIAEVAFKEGEIDLTRFLRVRNEATEARSHLHLMRVRQRRALAMLNQAAGQLPVQHPESEAP